MYKTQHFEMKLIYKLYVGVDLASRKIGLIVLIVNLWFMYTTSLYVDTQESLDCIFNIYII